MGSNSLCFIAMAVLLRAVLLDAAISDVICLTVQLKFLEPDNYFETPDYWCENFAARLNFSLKETKKCSLYEIDVTPLETLHHDFCDSHSVYRQKFDRQKTCLGENILRIKGRTSNLDECFLYYENVPVTSITEQCNRKSLEASECFNDRIAKPCGQEAQEVYGRVTKAMEPFFRGICVAAARKAPSKTVGGSK